MQRLGGTVICELTRFHRTTAKYCTVPLISLSVIYQGVNEKDSSAQKGESIKDTTQTLASYCDAIVLRHPMKGAAETAVSVSSIPVINAGETDGLEHVMDNWHYHACKSYYEDFRRPHQKAV